MNILVYILYILNLITQNFEFHNCNLNRFHRKFVNFEFFV